MKLGNLISFLMLALLFPAGVTAEIITVGTDGTQQYTSIQAGISHSSNGDIVQVSPGEYFEHLNTMGRNITIRSLYTFTQSEETINSTIIHASFPNSCLWLYNNESVTIDGFTMINNLPEILSYPHVDGWNLKGGGIDVYEGSSIQITNCVIRNCYGQGAGGVFFIGNNFYMSNTKIFGCHGVDGPGGLAIGGDGLVSVIFDPVLPNSVYNNISFNGMDVYLADLPQPLDLVLDTFSVILSEPDWFYFMYDTYQALSISVQHASLELVNHDLYVSPDGDDNNTGLSSQYPLKTLARAVQIIAPDSLDPKTIHLAPGEYNLSGSGQFFPLPLKSHTRLIGDNPELVVFNMENTGRGCLSLFNQHYIEIENITFIPHDIETTNTYPVFITYCQRVELRNLRWNGSHENYFDDFTRIRLGYCDGVICENITARNATTNDHQNLAVSVEMSRNVFLNNILADNLVGLSDAFNIGLEVYESDATVRNTVISNCYTNFGLMFWYQAWVTEDVSLDLSNLLFINNIATSPDMGAPIYIFNQFERVQIRNCTLAHNDVWSARVMKLRGFGDIYNCLFYNSNNHYSLDLLLDNVYDGDVFNPTVSYSLFTEPISADDSTAVTLGNLMIGTNPQFEGYGLPEWDAALPTSYHLSSNSPCVNAGTPDASGLNLPPMDLAGNYRIWDGRIDMGCYEYGSEPYVANPEPELPVPQDKIVLSLFPNPVRASESKAGYVFIEFSLPREALAEPVVQIYNLKGQRVKTIRPGRAPIAFSGSDVQNPKEPGGFYSTVYDCCDESGRKLSSGIYLVRIEAGEYQGSGKMTFIK
jgi:hypothetical protein